MVVGNAKEPPSRFTSGAVKLTERGSGVCAARGNDCRGRDNRSGDRVPHPNSWLSVSPPCRDRPAATVAAGIGHHAKKDGA